MPPESTSDRTSSFVKNGLPSLAREASAPALSATPVPTSVSRNAWCSDDRERTEHDRQRPTFPLEPLDQPIERVPRVGLCRAVGPDDQYRRRTQAPNEVLERFEGNFSRVQVLETAGREGRSARDARQRPGQQLEDLVRLSEHAAPLTGQRAASRRRADFGDLAEHGKQSHELGRQVRQIGGRRAALSFRRKCSRMSSKNS